MIEGRLVVVWCVAVAVLAHAIPARAQSADERRAISLRLRVALEAAPGDLPDHVCVLIPSKTVHNEYLRLVSGYSATQEGKVVHFNPDADRRGLGSRVSAVRALLASQAPCNSRECAPNVELPYSERNKDVTIQCQSNDRSGQASQAAPTGGWRVAVILLSIEAESAPGVDSISLDGSALTLKFDSPIGVDSFRAAVVGGHYEAESDEPSRNRQVALPLVRRCQIRRVEIPTQQSPLSIEVRLGSGGGAPGDEVLECGLRGRFQGGLLSIGLPRTGGEPKVVTFTLHPPDRPGMKSVFEALWDDDQPRSVLPLRVRQVSFVWQRSCFHPRIERVSECPAARLAEVGLDCQPPSEDPSDQTVATQMCSYVCRKPRSAEEDSELATSFELPTLVRFSSVLADWDETLSGAGQRLRGYAGPSARYLIPDYGRWVQNTEQLEEFRSRPFRQIDALVVNLPDGVTRRIELEQVVQAENSSAARSRNGLSPEAARRALRLATRVLLPGARCHDVLVVQVDGTQHHGATSGTVSDGRLQLQPPQPNLVSYSISLGVGLRATPFSVEGEWDLTGRPYLVGDAAVAFDFPWSRPFFLSGSLAGIVGRREYYPLQKPSEALDEESVWYGYVLVGPTLLLPLQALVRDMALGLGFDFGLGFAVADRDVERVGTLQSVWAPRFVFSTGSSSPAVQFTFRALFDDEVVVHDTSFHGAPATRLRTPFALLADVDLGFTL